MARLPPDLVAAGGGEFSGEGPPLRDLGVAGGRPSAASAGAAPATKDLTFCRAPRTEKSTTPMSPARRENTIRKSRKKKNYKITRQKNHAFEAKTPLRRRRDGGGEASGIDFLASTSGTVCMTVCLSVYVQAAAS